MTGPVSSSLPPAVTGNTEPTSLAKTSGPQPATEAPAHTGDVAEISDNAKAATVMLAAAQEAKQNEASNPALEMFAQAIASGIYKPPPEAVAEALVRYESKLLGGS